MGSKIQNGEQIESVLPNEYHPTRTKVSWSRVKSRNCARFNDAHSTGDVVIIVFMFRLCLQAQKLRIVGHGGGSALH